MLLFFFLVFFFFCFLKGVYNIHHLRRILCNPSELKSLLSLTPQQYQFHKQLNLNCSIHNAINPPKSSLNNSLQQIYFPSKDEAPTCIQIAQFHCLSYIMCPLSTLCPFVLSELKQSTVNFSIARWISK